MLRLAWRDVMPAYAGVIDPGQDGVGRIFRGVVAMIVSGPPAPQNDGVQLARYRLS